VGAKRTAFNGGKGKGQVSVPDDGVFVVTQDLTKNQVDAELNDLHGREVNWKKSGKDVQLVVRVMFGKDAADSDGSVRISPASVRLVAGGNNVFPVGTLENGVLYSNKVDDFLFINVKGADSGADFVFFVNPDDVLDNAGAASAKEGAKDASAAASKVKDGVFVEVKRLARIDLSGKTVGTTIPKAENVQVERKPKLLEQKKNKAAAAAAAAAAPPAQPNPDTAAPAAPAPAEKKNPMATIKEGAKDRNEKIENPK
jgi:hypothetical protein